MLPASSQTSAANLPPGLVRILGDARLCVSSEVLALAFPSAETVCTMEESGVLRVWNAINGTQRSWRFLSQRATHWQFTQDARYLASAGRDLCWWDVRTGELLGVHSSPDWVTALAFRDGGVAESLILATGMEGGQLAVWGNAGKYLLRTLLGHGQEISALAFSPEGARLASASEDKVVCIWELPTGRCIGEFHAHTDRVVALAWHPKGQHLVSAGWDGRVWVWDSATSVLLPLVDAPGPALHALAFEAAGCQLAAVDATGMVRVWNWGEAKPSRTYQTGGTRFRLLCFNPAADHLAVAGEDRRVQILSRTQEPEHAIHPAHRTASSQFDTCARGKILAVSPEGKLLAELGEVNRVRVWEEGTLRATLAIHPQGDCHAVAFSPDGRWLAVGSDEGAVHLWDQAAARWVRTLEYEGQCGPLNELIVAPDSTWLAGASSAGTSLCLWHLAEEEPTWFFGNAVDGCSVESLAASGDGRLLAAGGIDWLATGGSTGLLVVWELPTWREVAAFEEGVTALAFHPSRKTLAFACLDGPLRIWDLDAQEPRLELPVPRGLVNALAFSPDGLLLASGGEDRCLRCWNSTTGALQARIELDSRIYSLAFSPDGRFLFTAHGNGSTLQFTVDACVSDAVPNT